MDYWEYAEELQLIETQNNVEQDLYNVIIRLLKQIEGLNKYSIRDISGRRRTVSGSEKPYWGIKGFPDIAILDKSDGNNIFVPATTKDIHAVVEVKALGKSLDTIDCIRQLTGHLLSFGRVIHTNGYVWRFYDLDLSHYKLEKKYNEDYTYDIRGNSKESDAKWKMVNTFLDQLVQLHDDNNPEDIWKPYAKVDLKNNEQSEYDKLVKELDKLGKKMRT